jgi:GH24 family phage-related lysozyme (muramidase)/peptidoglycan hydrolase-like protein with peptidoglycan-binding domain
MKINEEGFNLIKSYEGCRLIAYKALPSEKYFTIGWGHYGSDVKEGMVISQAAADELFKKDLERFEGYVDHYTKHLSLNVNQFSALVSFTYNCGAGNLKKLVEGRNTLQIANAMLNFNHAGGKELAGLTRRRMTERELFLKPVEEEKMKYIIGSARIDENGKASNGAAGDNKQKSTPDYAGEVSLQAFYVHSKGWYVLRPKDPSVAEDLSCLMKICRNNPCIGYDQLQRLDILKHGVYTQQKTECDCSSLVRAIIIEATGKDPGNFITSNEADKLEASGLFEKRVKYTNGMILYEGDVLVSCSKGHTAIVCEGYKRTSNLTNNDKVVKKSGVKLDITMPLIKSGSKGLAVAIWNCILGNVCYVTEFDETMEKQTRAFQEKYGLEVDGIVGKNSWTKGFEQV